MAPVLVLVLHAYLIVLTQITILSHMKAFSGWLSIMAAWDAARSENHTLAPRQFDHRKGDERAKRPKRARCRFRQWSHSAGLTMLVMPAALLLLDAIDFPALSK